MTGMSNPIPWIVLVTDEDPVPHTVPVNDLREHLREDCWCQPRQEFGPDHGLVICHNSMDRREHTYEVGKLQ